MVEQFALPFGDGTNALAEESIRLSNAVLARRTLKGYAEDWNRFSEWCRNAGHCCLPASSETLNLYFTSSLKDRRIITIWRYLSAILHYHRKQGIPSPDTTRARAILLGAQRLRGERPRQKRPISIPQLHQMIQHLDRPEPYRTRDRAVLCFAFATALRRISIIELRLDHVRFISEGMLVHIPHEKQDQEGRGRNIGVPWAKNTEICAARATKDWLTLRGDPPGFLFDGLWHGQFRPECQMCHTTVGNIVKRAAESIGLDPAQYAGHSLRSGFITTALESGVGEILTARHSGHRSLGTLRMYMRSEDPFAGNACKLIGF